MTTFRFLSAVIFTSLLFTIRALAGSAPTEFLNIPWKSAPTEAKRLMSQRAGVSIKEESPERILLEGGVFATHPVERLELEFSSGRFHRGTVLLTIPPGNGKDGAPLRNHQFEDYYKSLTEKYGKGARLGDGKHPVKKDDL